MGLSAANINTYIKFIFPKF